MSLDSLGILYGTDKSSLVHNYLNHYERLLSHLRDDSFNLMEIGIQDGASLRTWRAYFRHATIVGLDIAPGCRRHASGRIKVEIGSQEDGDFLRGVAQKYPPTVIIDDGSHRADHQISTFECLFPTLASRGCYIIEDLSSDLTTAESPETAPDYLARIMTGLMLRRPVDTGRTPTFDTTTIGSVDVLPGAVAFWKTPQAPDYAEDISFIEDLVNRSGVPLAWGHFAHFLEDRVRAFEPALAAARRGAELEPQNPWFQLRIATILTRVGHIDQAMEAAQRAVTLRPDIPTFQAMLDHLRAVRQS